MHFIPFYIKKDLYNEFYLDKIKKNTIKYPLIAIKHKEKYKFAGSFKRRIFYIAYNYRGRDSFIPNVLGVINPDKKIIVRIVSLHPVVLIFLLFYSYLLVFIFMPPINDILRGAPGQPLFMEFFLLFFAWILALWRFNIGARRFEKEWDEIYNDETGADAYEGV